MILYHGTSIQSMIGILNNGFAFDHCGKNWGSTYGKGIYFTPNYETARCYAGEDGVVLSFVIDVTDYKVLSKFKRPKKIQKKWLITPDFDEYIMLR